jgi:hypothetical protein
MIAAEIFIKSERKRKGPFLENGPKPNTTGFDSEGEKLDEQPLSAQVRQAAKKLTTRSSLKTCRWRFGLPESHSLDLLACKEVHNDQVRSFPSLALRAPKSPS